MAYVAVTVYRVFATGYALSLWQANGFSGAAVVVGTALGAFSPVLVTKWLGGRTVVVAAALSAKAVARAHGIIGALIAGRALDTETVIAAQRGFAAAVDHFIAAGTVPGSIITATAGSHCNGKAGHQTANVGLHASLPWHVSVHHGIKRQLSCHRASYPRHGVCEHLNALSTCVCESAGVRALH